MMWGYGWDMGWMWLIGPLTLVVIVLLVLLAVRLFGGGRGGISARRGSVQTKTPARLILDERFAKGEVTADQYREQLQVLGDS
ncbi:SHOCT domain-containing protein [Leifsonia sp. H3M29-4]|jgi:putative membrane protein|uniref:SHOCT domain-containing protein n=1 Tax=Salinibacterium metalliresistens TaxID=3031321 RepID=UPI0023DC5F05|nr:SHOCT domain-containing protein [Salinibacterium metalliresistens]MDF1479711.1 SHOCT domain-containing protein [Salinibacterium metalliresistens]